MEDVGGSAHCVQCGYDLSGSPDIGRCPECGQDYDRRTGKGIASSTAIAHQRGDRIVTFIKVGVVVAIGVASVVVGIVGSVRSDDWSRSMVVGGGMGLALFAIAGLIWWNDALERKQR